MWMATKPAYKKKKKYTNKGPCIFRHWMYLAVLVRCSVMVENRIIYTRIYIITSTCLLGKSDNVVQATLLGVQSCFGNLLNRTRSLLASIFFRWIPQTESWISKDYIYGTRKYMETYTIIFMNNSLEVFHFSLDRTMQEQRGEHQKLYI